MRKRSILFIKFPNYFQYILYLFFWTTVLLKYLRQSLNRCLVFSYIRLISRVTKLEPSTAKSMIIKNRGKREKMIEAYDSQIVKCPRKNQIGKLVKYASAETIARVYVYVCVQTMPAADHAYRILAPLGLRE